MYVIKGKFLNRYPVYFSVLNSPETSVQKLDCVADIDEATTFVKKETAENFVSNISDYFSMNQEAHYSDIHAIKVKLQEVEEKEKEVKK